MHLCELNPKRLPGSRCVEYNALYSAYIVTFQDLWDQTPIYSTHASESIGDLQNLALDGSYMFQTVTNHGAFPTHFH